MYNKNNKTTYLLLSYVRTTISMQQSCKNVINIIYIAKSPLYVLLVNRFIEEMLLSFWMCLSFQKGFKCFILMVFSSRFLI